MEKRLMTFIACLFLSLGMALAQTQVSGKVTSAEDGEPIIGASIKVAGTNTGTVTDINGNFSLNAPTNAKLEISYIGMTSTSVKAGKNMKIVLEPDAKVLDDVVVVAYGTAKKSAYTGSASEIKATKIENRQISNVSSALIGTMSGVQTLQSSGQPGSETKIRVRGISSINGVTAPLYVVDGVPFDGDLSAINSQDIASMTVLKDAVSTSLYGSRGSNGVVMITTKKGQQGRTQITADAKWGAVSREVANYDVIKNPGEYYEQLYKGYYNGYRYNSGFSATKSFQLANNDLSKTGYQIYTVPSGQYLVGKNGKLNPQATLGYTDGTNYFTPDAWEDATFRTTFRQEYNVGISGASDVFSYYSSFSYLQDDGTIKGSGFDRLTGRTNVEYKAKKWLTIGSNMAYTHTVSNSPINQDENSTNSSGNAFFIANNIAPIYPMYVRDATGNIMYDKASGNKIYDYGDGESTGFARNWMSMANPLGDLTYNKTEYNMDIFEGNWFAKADLTHGFTATVRLGLNTDNTIIYSYNNPLYGQSSSYGGEISNSQTRTTALTHQYLLNYQNSFGKHNISALAGFEGYRLKVTDFYGDGQQIYRMNDYILGNSTSKFTAGGTKNEYHTAGYFFSGSYNYDETYFVNIGYRRDGTSAFAKNNRWGNFFNFGLGWNMKKESWLQDFEALDQLKLRTSFGQTGNDNHNYNLATTAGDDPYAGWYAYQDIFKMTGTDGVFADGTLKNKGNADLKWEKTNAFDFGADYSFFKSRLYGSLDFFFRATSNLLDFKQVALINGYSKIPINMGTVQNYGVEFEINYDIIKNQNMQWSVNFNGTWTKNRIHKLSSDYENGQYINGERIYKEGESIYNFYLPKYLGVNEKGEALYLGVKMNKDPETGKDTTPAKDAEGNYIEEATTDYENAYEYNRKESGDILPKVYGGLGTTFAWKGLDFAIQTSFQLGGRIYDQGYSDLMTTGGTAFSAGHNFHKDILDAWSEDNTSSNIPRVDFTDKYAASSSDRFYTSSDYFSIDNITLGYTLPKSVLSHIGIQGLRFYGSIENVAIFSARKGMDPRMSLTYVSSSWYTARRTISGGIKLTF